MSQVVDAVTPGAPARKKGSKNYFLSCRLIRPSKEWVSQSQKALDNLNAGSRPSGRDVQLSDSVLPSFEVEGEDVYLVLTSDALQRISVTYDMFLIFDYTLIFDRTWSELLCGAAYDGAAPEG